MCNVAYVSRHASSGSDGHASTPTVSMLGEGIVGIARVAHAPLWLLDRRNRGQMRTGSNRRHAGPLPSFRPVCEAYQERGPWWGGSRIFKFLCPSYYIPGNRPGERFRSAPATTQDVPLPDETEASP